MSKSLAFATLLLRLGKGSRTTRCRRSGRPCPGSSATSPSFSTVSPPGGSWSRG